MSDDLPIDSLNVRNTQNVPPISEGNSNNAESKEIISLNFKSEAAQVLAKVGLPIMGYGVEVGYRLATEGPENIANAAEQIEKFEDKHPVLSRVLTVVSGPIKLLDAVVNSNK